MEIDGHIPSKSGAKLPRPPVSRWKPPWSAGTFDAAGIVGWKPGACPETWWKIGLGSTWGVELKRLDSGHRILTQNFDAGWFGINGGTDFWDLS